MYSLSAAIRVVGTYVVLNPNVRRATKYLAPDKVVKATRRFKRYNTMSTDVVLTVGRPNYRERRKIALFRKAGVPFPVRRIQFDAWPRKAK